MDLTKEFEWENVKGSTAYVKQVSTSCHIDSASERDKTFLDTYQKWKEGMKILRLKMKNEMSDEQLADIMNATENLHICVLNAFEQLPKPVNALRLRQMDSCTANTDNMYHLAQVRMSENGLQPWDSSAEKARLRLMLDVEYAASVYSSSEKTRSNVDVGHTTSQRSVIMSNFSEESIATKRAEATAKLVAKEVELETLHQKVILETNLRKLEAEKEVKIARAMVNAYDKEMKSNIEREQYVREPQEQVSKSEFNPNAKEFKPQLVTNHTQALEDSVKTLSTALQESFDYNHLPTREPSTFSGDPLNFIKWKRSFETLIGNKRVKTSDKLALLERYVTGEAAACIDGMFYRSDDEAYNDAWKALNERYGHPSVVTSAFRKKLYTWPKIGPKDYSQLRNFSDFLLSIDGASSQLPGLKHLNDAEENRKLLLKLPDWLITKWGNVVATHDQQGLNYPSFHDFTVFMSAQTKIATRPVCSLQALKGDGMNGQQNFTSTTKKPKATVMVTNTVYDNHKESVSATHKTEMKTKNKSCAFCNSKEHYLPNCPKFLNDTLVNRKKFVEEKKRCFKCLRTGHMSKECTQPHKCKTCGRKHPTSLHDENFKYQGERMEPSAAAMTHTVNSCLSSSSTSITLPVWISSKENPTKEILVYALIDSQSDTTFLDQAIVHHLDIPQSSRQTTRLKIDTIQESRKADNICERVCNLQVRGYSENTYVDLPPAFTIDNIPLKRETIPTTDKARNWSHLQDVAQKLPPPLNCESGILIGFNCSHAFIPRECVVGGDSEPFAIKTDLGWGIIGQASPSPLIPSIDGESVCSRITAKELPLISPQDACQILETDFQNDKNEGEMSQEDLKFLQILDKSIIKDNDGHLEMPLPFKDTPKLPNNFNLAAKRLDHLKKRLLKDKAYYDEYCQFMNTVLQRGEAEEAPPAKGQEWYIPHHGVFHPKKRKLRVVFDCSAKFNNTSLNDHLLTGPNLINNLTGVLCRFRKFPIAITCDIEKMFHQFRVTEEHRDFLRFLWWKDGDLSQPPTVYRMKVHLFGASSSPGCANYGLKYLAKENSDLHPEASTFIQEDFYVDDGLSSQPNEEKATNLVREAVQVCAQGSLRLHKFTSNSPKVLQSIPESERAEPMPVFDLNFDSVPMERVLGMQWRAEHDTLHFSFSPLDRPFTRRGILAVVASLYDPLGLIAPFTLTGKQILQKTCNKGMGWDEPVSDEIQVQWKAWLADLQNLSQLSIPRCYFPKNFGTLTNVQLHHFADASFQGYGMCSYIRAENETGQIHCSLVTAKSRVAPRKVMSVPRLELTAALVAAEVGTTIKQKLKIDIDREFFWTDSQVVLGYINNDARKFHVFVANRVQKIKDLTQPCQWHHVKTIANPADHVSRGLRASNIPHTSWFTGPEFLWKNFTLPTHSVPNLIPEDPEVRVSLKTDTSSHDLDLNARISHISKWTKAARVIARIMRLRHSAVNPTPANITLEEIHRAKDLIIRNTQSQYLPHEMNRLLSGGRVSQTSPVYHAEPFLQDGIIRAGGRLKNDSYSLGERHPIILPKNCHVTELVISHCHERMKHQGRGMTLNEIRTQGFWIIGGSRQVSKIIRKCVTCRKLRGIPEEQRMADLPKDRTEPSSPFTFVGMDCFGPILTKNGRREIKRYGLLFTCLCSRAVHLEMLDDLSTDALINGLRCFIALRGTVLKIYCDCGTNFVGANNELNKAMQEMDKVSEYFRDQLTFIFNTPYASHAGGVWERQVGTVKAVLKATTSLCPGRLDDSSLRTLLYESMAIVNSRPITAINQGDPISPEPLTPNHLITMKPSIPLPPPGKFLDTDMYTRKRWRRVQYLTEQFWTRWRKEYVLSMSQRPKWLEKRRNIMVGDVVLLSEPDLPRGQWHIGRITLAQPDSDGLVRHVRLILGTKGLDSKGRRQSRLSEVERPVNKLVVILENK